MYSLQLQMENMYQQWWTTVMTYPVVACSSCIRVFNVVSGLLLYMNMLQSCDGRMFENWLLVSVFV